MDRLKLTEEGKVIDAGYKTYEDYLGIVRNKGYIFWTNVCITDNFIFEFIKNKFPNGLVLPEFCMIDWFVLEKDLPIEIQSTMLKPSGTPAHAAFEKSIRTQLEQNIKNYEKCWFFFDSEYLRYLQNDIEKNISINYDWFYKLMEEGKLIVFTCSFDGKIKETTTKEFEFIKKYSSTCITEENQDSRTMQRNKSKIAYNILKNKGIKSDDMVKLRNKLLQIKYEKNLKGTFYQFGKYLENQEDKSICNIYRMLGGELEIINKALDCKIDENNKALDCKIDENNRDNRMTIYFFDVLGLTEQMWGGQQHTIRRFTDKDNICQYFTGYLRNKDKQDYLKESKMNLTKRQLDAIIRGKINPLDWKKLINGGW